MNTETLGSHHILMHWFQRLQHFNFSPFYSHQWKNFAALSEYDTAHFAGFIDDLKKRELGRQKNTFCF